MSWIAVGTIAASAGSAAYSANQQKKQAKDAAAAVEGNQVKPPNATQAARRAWIEQYNLAPMVARQDQRIRHEMAPQQAQLASDLYAKFFPQMAATNLATLRKVDPESIDGRKALYGTVFDELQQGRGMSAETQRQITQAARGALAAFGLAACMHLPVRALSQGQKRRSVLARLALSAHAPLWILDEPFAALDVDAVTQLEQRILAHVAGGGCVMFTTHQTATIAANITQCIDLDDLTAAACKA